MIWRMYYKKLGGHIHCRLFCGPIEGALGLAGTLVFREDEFTELTRLRKVIQMDFRNETDDSGEPVGDYSGVKFAPLV